MTKNKRVIRNYDISQELYDWLKEKAFVERRSIVKQVESIIDAAYREDKKVLQLDDT